MFGLLWGVAAAAAAGTWSLSQLTTDHDAQQYVQSGDRLMWTNGLGSMYTWKLGDAAPVAVDTPSDENENGTDLSGDRLVWCGSASGSTHIYTFKVGDPAATLVSTTSNRNARPAVSGDRVVWDADSSSSSPGVYTWTAASPTPYKIAEAGNGADVSGNRIVFVDEVSGDPQIFIWTQGDLAPTRISTTSVYNLSPQIDGDRVVWYDISYNVWTWKVGDVAPTLVDSATSFIANPQISGDLITYLKSDGVDDEVYVYNAATSITTQVTNDSVAAYGLKIAGTRLGWFSADGNVFTWAVGDAAPTAVTTAGSSRLIGVSDTLIGVRTDDRQVWAAAPETEPDPGGGGVTSTPASSEWSVLALAGLGFAVIVAARLKSHSAA